MIEAIVTKSQAYKRLEKLLQEATDRVNPQATEIREVTRLRLDAYLALEKLLPHPGAPKDAIHAAYMAGVAHVLKLLRDGYVVA